MGLRLIITEIETGINCVIRRSCCISLYVQKSFSRDCLTHLCQLFYTVSHTLGRLDVGKCMTGGSTWWQKDENGMASLATHVEDLVETFVRKFVWVCMESLTHKGRNCYAQSIWPQQAKDDQTLKVSPWAFTWTIPLPTLERFIVLRV